MKMRILISNDDGIYSPGIFALAKVASRFGDVRIVAPDVEQSSASHAITASRPLRSKRIKLGDFDAYRDKLRNFVYQSGTTMEPVFDAGRLAPKRVVAVPPSGPVTVTLQPVKSNSMIVPIRR